MLRIQAVKEEDEADYRCTAQLGDRVDDANITLKVSRAPDIQALPDVKRVQGGQKSLTYGCATENNADKVTDSLTFLCLNWTEGKAKTMGL